MAAIYDVSRRHNIPVHLDGARLFNAAAYLKVDASEITKYCDSVMPISIKLLFLISYLPVVCLLWII